MTETRDRFTRMLCTAQEMEEKGKAFYDKAMSTSENPLGKEIFRLLIEDEIVHLERIRKISDSLTRDQNWSEDWKKLQCPYQDLGQVFRDLTSQYRRAGIAGSNDLEALKLALDFERRSVEFYENQLAQAIDPLEKAFLVQMILEEKGHSRTLQDTQYYLSDPEGWFIEKERAGLDGA
jgi:rubrerythrin